jgi:glutamate formiminotransferase/formiminotetrahydrofolate cyclodeaminase
MATKNTTLDAFSQVLASSQPAPGGGSAAALAGSLAASLVCMVSALTIGKKAYLSVEREMQSILIEATQLRDQLLEEIDTDTEAFNHVMAAMKLPQTTEAEKTERRVNLEKALKHATEVPFAVAKICERVLELTKVVAEKGNKNAVSDAGAAALLGESALQTALLNVDINLVWITDAAFKSEFSQKRADLAQSALQKRTEILNTVQMRLKG